MRGNIFSSSTCVTFSVLYAAVDILVCVTTINGRHVLTRACFVLQNEKCHLLIENETLRLKHLDEQHNQLLKEWRDQLKPRKKVRGFFSKVLSLA